MIVEFSDGPRVGRRGARLPLIFRPNWGPKSRKNNSLRPPPPPLPPYDRAPLIWGTGSDIGIINKYSPILTRFWYYRIFKSFRKRRIIFSLSAMRFIPYLAIDDFLTPSGSAFTSTVKLSLKVHKAENDVFSVSDIGESGKKIGENNWTTSTAKLFPLLYLIWFKRDRGGRYSVWVKTCDLWSVIWVKTCDRASTTWTSLSHMVSVPKKYVYILV